MNRAEHKIVKNANSATTKLIAALTAQFKLDDKARAGVRGQKAKAKTVEAQQTWDTAQSELIALLAAKPSKATAQVVEEAPPVPTVAAKRPKATRKTVAASKATAASRARKTARGVSA